MGEGEGEGEGKPVVKGAESLREPMVADPGEIGTNFAIFCNISP